MFTLNELFEAMYLKDTDRILVHMNTPNGDLLGSICYFKNDFTDNQLNSVKVKKFKEKHEFITLEIDGVIENDRIIF